MNCQLDSVASVLELPASNKLFYKDAALSPDPEYNRRTAKQSLSSQVKYVKFSVVGIFDQS